MSSSMRPKIRVVESVDDAMAAVYREKTPLERLRIAFGLWSSTRDMLASVLRSRHPDWDNEKIGREVARRMSHGAA